MKNTKTNNQNKHIPVLLDAVLQYLGPKEQESYLDLTAGYGGHAREVLKRTKNPAGAVLIDRDTDAVTRLVKTFAKTGTTILNKDFLSASYELMKAGERFDMILADLGVSSPHFDRAERGFSFQLEGPLDMRMDQRQTVSADTIVNSYGERELAELIRRYGQEPKADKIARLIVANRPLHSTRQLAAVIARAWPGRSRIHPATRTFQALRLAVNQELEQLRQALPFWIKLLSPGGRIAVISFHSLEDRIVKQQLSDAAGNRYDAVLRLLTRQPITAATDEIVFNPRARSAKLRAAVKK